YMDEGIDTGDIIAVAPVEIGENETSGDVFDKVSALGAVTLTETIAALGAGKVIRTPQDHSKATLAPPLTKEQSLFSFDAPAPELHNRIRGLYPWPGAHFMQDGKKIKVIMARKSLLCGTPGEVLLLNPLTIACATQALELREVVPEGKRPMQGSEWAAGRRLKKGDLLGS
ncbi:MAG: methionyl-tRNA formyltransferase, partial [Pygmaiobacter sp.]